MKNILYITALLLITACSKEKKQSLENILATNNLETIREKRANLVTEQQSLVDKLKQIDDKIATLDTIKKVPLITTITTKPELFKHYLELQGNVQTKQNIVITPETNGILKAVYVKEGQYVSKGKILAKIDDGGLSQQKAQLEIQTNLAKTTYERQKRLWNQKIGSEIQYLQAKSQYEALQKSVNQINQQLAKTNVKAPFSGIIDEVITEQGNVVGAGQTPLMRIVNLNNMYIETDVPENYISNITKNKEVIVNFPVLDKTIQAKVRQTGSYINPANRTFKVEIAVPNKDKKIKPNLTAKLKINDYTSENAILIPQSIISENAKGEQYVYVVENKNIVKRAIIKTGKTQGDIIEVINGLQPDTELVKEGARTVKDGQEVEVIATK